MATPTQILPRPGRQFRGRCNLLRVPQVPLEQTAPRMPDQLGATWDGRARAPRLDARRLETGQASVAARLGLGAAIEGALAIASGRLQARIARLAAQLRGGLRGIPGVRVHDPPRAF